MSEKRTEHPNCPKCGSPPIMMDSWADKEYIYYNYFCKCKHNWSESDVSE